MNDYSSNDLWQLDACEMAEGIAKRDFSSRELVSACLNRIDDVNPLINAITETRADAALEQADAADQALASGKNHQGLLHGIPVTKFLVLPITPWIVRARPEAPAVALPPHWQ